VGIDRWPFKENKTLLRKQVAPKAREKERERERERESFE
jgi:hypothetical protein